MKMQMLIFPLVVAMICTIVFSTVEVAYSENATKAGDVCLSCGESNGTNLTNATMGGNATNNTLCNPLLDNKSG
jgi:hypothetical protein